MPGDFSRAAPVQLRPENRPSVVSAPDFHIRAGLLAPKGTPRPVVAKPRDALQGVVDAPDFKAAMDELETPAAFKQDADFNRFSDARRLTEGVWRVGRIETK